MTDHKPLPVAGYTPQSRSNVDLVNEGKQLEERVLRYIEKVESHIPAGEQRRFLVTGKTDIQKGWMMVYRAVFNPSRVVLPEDGTAMQEQQEASVAVRAVTGVDDLPKS